MKQRSFLKIVLSLLLMGLVVFSGCNQLIPATAPPPEPELLEDYNPVVSASGIVVPEQWASLSMVTTGVVEEVLVKEGDLVTAGQPLVRLRGKEHLQASIEATHFEVVSAQQALDALYDDLDLAQAQSLQAIVNSRRAIEEAERELANLQSQSSTADINQARANLVLARDKLDRAREDFEPYKNKPEDNLTRAALLSKLAQAEKEYETAVRRLNNLLGVADELDIAEVQAKLALARVQLAKAERDYDTWQSGPDPDDVLLAQARLENAKAQLEAAQAALNDLELQAPFTGTISQVFIHVGEWVTPGQPVLMLADLKELHVETTDLNEIDVARIAPGDEVVVTFDALPDVVVNSQVDRIAVKATEGAGVNYAVVVVLGEIPAGLRWGMTAFVDILIK